MTNLNINKVTSTYRYENKQNKKITEVGFFVDSRLDRYGNVLRKVNYTDKYGEVKSIPYSGKTLMISISNDLRTTCIKRVTREELEKYSLAYKAYLETLPTADRKEQEEKLYDFLGEPAPEVKKEPKKDSKIE